MNEFFNAVIDPAVKTLITALIGYALYTGLPKLVDALLKSRAKSLVFAAESLFPGSGTGKEKLQYVVDRLNTYAKRLLAFIKNDRLRAYAEAAVTELHAELPASLGAAEKQVEDAKDAETASTTTAQSAQPVTTNPDDQQPSSEQGTTAK